MNLNKELKISPTYRDPILVERGKNKDPVRLFSIFT